MSSKHSGRHTKFGLQCLTLKQFDQVKAVLTGTIYTQFMSIEVQLYLQISSTAICTSSLTRSEFKQLFEQYIDFARGKCMQRETEKHCRLHTETQTEM